MCGQQEKSREGRGTLVPSSMHFLSAATFLEKLVPSKGLEPPHPCEYMDLNHARLPIPPRWHCGLTLQRRPWSRRVRKTYRSILQSDCELSNFGSPWQA